MSDNKECYIRLILYHYRLCKSHGVNTQVINLTQPKWSKYVELQATPQFTLGDRDCSLGSSTYRLDLSTISWYVSTNDEH